MTLGEQRVRTEFNPSNTGIVDEIKQKSADLINLINSIDNNEGRLKALALTDIESGCMCAVKAATAEM